MKSVIKDETLSTVDYNLGMMFKIMTSGDRSMFYVVAPTKNDKIK